jgi:hypothetical protein
MFAGWAISAGENGITIVKIRLELSPKSALLLQERNHSGPDGQGEAEESDECGVMNDEKNRPPARVYLCPRCKHCPDGVMSWQTFWCQAVYRTVAPIKQNEGEKPACIGFDPKDRKEKMYGVQPAD